MAEPKKNARKVEAPAEKSPGDGTEPKAGKTPKAEKVVKTAKAPKVDETPETEKVTAKKAAGKKFQPKAVEKK